jgi:hypothetical protein
MVGLDAGDEQRSAERAVGGKRVVEVSLRIAPRHHGITAI